MPIRLYRPEDKDAILAIQRQQLIGWFGSEPTPDMMTDLDGKLHLFTMVLEEDGKILAAFGCKSTVEIVTTLDMSGETELSPLFDKLRALWAATAIELGKRGYNDCVARVGPHIKKWANTLVKRAGFQRMNTQSLWFDIEKWCRNARQRSS